MLIVAAKSFALQIHRSLKPPMSAVSAKVERVIAMAKGNGRLTPKSVSVWFEAMPFDGQVALLNELQKIHSKVRQVQINALKRQLAALENGSSNGHAGPSVPKRQPKKSNVKVKYRDPKTGGTWSGRGRMATWLAEKVKAGEKADKYLA